MKSFLFSLLTYTTSFSYSNYCEWWLKKCRTPSQKDRTKVFCLSRNGKQGKQFSDESHWLLKLRCWKSPDALTVIQLLRLKLSNLLSHWLSNKKPLKLLSTVEGQPLPPIKAIGAINRMITDNSTRGNRARVLLHVLGGV